MSQYDSQYVTFSKIQEGIYDLIFHDVNPTPEEFETYLSGMKHIYNTEPGVVFIFEATKARYLSSDLRIRQGDWIIENEKLIKAACYGHVYLITNTLIKIVLKAIFIITKPPVQYSVVANYDEATKTAQQWLSNSKKQ